MTSLCLYPRIKEDIFVGLDVVYLRIRKLQTQSVVWHSVSFIMCACLVFFIHADFNGLEYRLIKWQIVLSWQSSHMM